MRRLTIMRTPGDPERLLAVKREHIDPVMESKAGEYGNLFHVAAYAPDGMVVVNLWESEEGSERAFQDPEVQRAQDAMRESGAATGQPEFLHYEVVDYRESRNA